MSAQLKDIGGRKFAFGMMPPSKSVRVQIVIARVIGEPLFKLITEAKDDDQASAQDKAAQFGAFASVIGLLAAKLDADELLRCMATVFDYVSVDGQRIVSIDEAFAGRNKDLWAAFIAALKVNYADFMPAALSASLAGKLPASS